MNSSAATEQHDPSMCYRQASRGWVVYFTDKYNERHEGIVRNVLFSTGRRTSVEVDVPDPGGHRTVSIRFGSLESKTFLSK